MENTNVLLTLMQLAVAINNKDAVGVATAEEALVGVTLSTDQINSISTYEDNLINRASLDNELLGFLQTSSATTIDSAFVIALAKVNTSTLTADEIMVLVTSSPEFSTPLKQYRFFSALSRKAIELGDSALIEAAIEKVQTFNTSFPTFTPPTQG